MGRGGTQIRRIPADQIRDDPPNPRSSASAPSPPDLYNGATRTREPLPPTAPRAHGRPDPEGARERRRAASTSMTPASTASFAARRPPATSAAGTAADTPTSPSSPTGPDRGGRLPARAGGVPGRGHRRGGQADESWTAARADLAIRADRPRRLRRRPRRARRVDDRRPDRRRRAGRPRGRRRPPSAAAGASTASATCSAGSPRSARWPRRRRSVRWSSRCSGAGAFAVRGLWFDKTERGQLEPPLAPRPDRRRQAAGRRPPASPAWTLKAGIPHARPPAEVLEGMLTVRLHLDDAGPENGPLRVHPRLAPARRPRPDRARPLARPGPAGRLRRRPGRRRR